MKITDEAAMLHFGQQLAKGLQPGHIVTINGTLGAGKTVLCRGILRGLGYDGDVSSPSYAIIHEYSPPDTHFPVVHADLYRIEDKEDFAELGLLDDIGDAILLVEWAERFDGLADMATKNINIEIEEGTIRSIILT